MSEKIKTVVNQGLAIAQDIGLIIVAIATLVAVGIEINFMVENGTVLLTDLLLLFIYPFLFHIFNSFMKQIYEKYFKLPNFY